MARHITATPSISLWASVESAVSLTLKSLSAPALQERASGPVDDVQTEIRRTARHWLVG